MPALTTEEINVALAKAARKLILEEDGLIGIPEQEVQEVMLALLEKAQVLAETLAKSGDRNAAWLHKKLHDVTEEFDLMELSASEEAEYEKNYVPDSGRGELPS